MKRGYLILVMVTVAIPNRNATCMYARTENDGIKKEVQPEWLNLFLCLLQDRQGQTVESPPSSFVPSKDVRPFR